MTTTTGEIVRRTPQQQFADDVAKSATEYLVNLVGDERGTRHAARLSLSLRTIARNTPKVYEADRASVVSCVALSALTGLSPGGPFPEVYVLPRNAKIKGRDGKPDTWVTELQWMISFRGMMKLARNAGYTVTAQAVYAGDEYEIDLAAARPVHRPKVGRDREPTWEELVGCYVIARDEQTQAIVGWHWMERWEIEKRRGVSDAYRRGAKPGAAEWEKSSPWFQWPKEMALKTVIRNAISRGLVPVDDAAGAALAEEERADRVVDAVSQPVAPRQLTAGAGSFDELMHEGDAESVRVPIEADAK